MIPRSAYRFSEGDLVRARLTIKTQGYGFLYAGPAY
jgi:hypothetical protein